MQKNNSKMEGLETFLIKLHFARIARINHLIVFFFLIFQKQEKREVNHSSALAIEVTYFTQFI